MRPFTTALFLALAACGSDRARGPDAPDDATVEPLRTLESRGLFGDMPIDNLVLDPQFALLDGVAWLALGGGGWDWPAMTRLHLPKTPTGQPALLASASEVGPGDVILGSTRSTEGSLDASVWIGRRLDAGDLEATRVSVSLAGVFLDGATEAVDLAAEGDPLVIDDLVWFRFAARVPEGPVGWANLVVVDDANDDLFLSAPVVVADKTKARLAPVARRTLHANELRAMAELKNNLRDRFHAPTIERP